MSCYVFVVIRSYYSIKTGMTLSSRLTVHKISDLLSFSFKPSLSPGRLVEISRQSFELSKNVQSLFSSKWGGFLPYRENGTILSIQILVYVFSVFYFCCSLKVSTQKYNTVWTHILAGFSYLYKLQYCIGLSTNFIIINSYLYVKHSLQRDL